MLKTKTKSLVLAAIFLAIGIVLPFLTGQIKEIGDSLLPMHFVVMLCGFICGKKYGLAVGIIMPVLRGACFGMPPIYPNAVWMAAELGAYGFVTGFLYPKLEKKGTTGVVVTLVSAMITGRIVWGMVKGLIFFSSGKIFLIQMFIAQGFIDAIPGIVLQLVLIPAIMFIIKKVNKSFGS